MKYQNVQILQFNESKFIIPIIELRVGNENSSCQFLGKKLLILKKEPQPLRSVNCKFLPFTDNFNQIIGTKLIIKQPLGEIETIILPQSNYSY
jgi:hypothetical protein